ncbi:MAG: hypothetical protein AB8B81_17845 [Halioglobus sp.]
MESLKIERRVQQIVFQEYIDGVEVQQQRVEDLEQAMEEPLAEWSLAAPVVEGLTALRGSGLTTAMKVCSHAVSKAQRKPVSSCLFTVSHSGWNQKVRSNALRHYQRSILLATVRKLQEYIFGKYISVDIMKNIVAILALACFLSASHSFALPILSSDGSLLTGIEYQGRIYDVMFGDGIVGDVYADVIFNTERFDEAHQLSFYIARALIDLGITHGERIAGCEVGQRESECRLFSPAEANPGILTAYFETRKIASDPWFVWDEGVSELSLLDDTALSRNVTLVTYRVAPSRVSAPTSLALLVFGFAGLGWSRRKKSNMKPV